MANLYDEKVNVILEELGQVFKRVSTHEVERLIAEILKAKKIVLIGVGREGLSTKAFTMRLMHLGLNVHWIWDETTPSIGKGDLLIATSGCGEIGHIHYVVEKAKKNGATTAVITGDPHKKTSKVADVLLFVPASVYLGTADVVPSIQPMGNLFEQSLLIIFDLIVMDLRERVTITKEEMEENHRNLE
ncbi:6-phospho-3-hexuloisomerase [Bacillus sp. SORGH_AS 510]|uniref:6-phospho-3-hexuloisomerase n=1 Tax=Bacillus sp. SORGH_AS_0510 TaxID=3041771 RepID=UPI00278A6EC2|nr:6-phospho-3-hexuloisomerase [Bacillus sp. SORGH_AS_0510]MDQ1143799.1 6-phospho-3-hexuloisomerase [Bacillus sp. SORGH_AS_0510]